MEPGEGRVLVKGRVTIDTRPPFKSVKEAVALFGERILVGEIYAKQLKEAELSKVTTLDKQSNITYELEETKKQLQKEREDGNYIAICIESLTDELEQTKKQLMQLKTAKNDSTEMPKSINPEIEELNFIGKSITNNPTFEDDHQQQEYQKRKFVTFASPPSLTREMLQVSNVEGGSFTRFGKTPLVRKGDNKDGKKKKPASPVVGWFFPRKKKNDEGNK